MQNHLIKAVVGASLALSPGIAGAKQPDAITVNGGEQSLQQWSGRVSRSLNDHLVYPVPFGPADYPEGAVRVAFHCSEDGSPAGLSIVQSSRSNLLDRAAVNAVQRISTLHPLPDGIGHDRTMEAWVFFASDQPTIDRMKKGFERQASQMARQERASGERIASLSPLIIASR